MVIILSTSVVFRPVGATLLLLKKLAGLSALWLKFSGNGMRLGNP